MMSPPCRQSTQRPSPAAPAAPRRGDSASPMSRPSVPVNPEALHLVRRRRNRRTPIGQLLPGTARAHAIRMVTAVRPAARGDACDRAGVAQAVGPRPALGRRHLADQPGTKNSRGDRAEPYPLRRHRLLVFIGVLRDRIGAHEDRFFATVFLGSGLLFVGMLFVAAAIAGGLIAASSSPSGPAARQEKPWLLRRRGRCRGRPSMNPLSCASCGAATSCWSRRMRCYGGWRRSSPARSAQNDVPGRGPAR